MMRINARLGSWRRTYVFEGGFHGFAKRRLGMALVTRDLDRYMMQLGKCLVENILQEE